ARGPRGLAAVLAVVRSVPLAEQVLLPAGLARDVRLTPANQPGVRLAQATGNDLGGDGDQLAVQRRLLGRESLEDLAWNLEHLCVLDRHARCGVRVLVEQAALTV